MSAAAVEASPLLYSGVSPSGGMFGTMKLRAPACARRVTSAPTRLAVAVTFARYFRELTGVTASDGWIACITLLALTALNCLGARTGSNIQSVLMILKAGAIAALVVAGLTVHGPAAAQTARVPASGIGALGAAMIPVGFAYGGWQTASFVAGEMRDARRDLSRGLILGVLGVIALYVSVNYVCVHVLGPAVLAETRTPASAVMRAAWGERGAHWLAFGIAISTLGFLGQGILTAPRVYYAMARDGLFFRSVGWISPRTGAPVVAIVVQGALAAIIVFIGRYEQILNYVVSIDFIFFGLTAASIFIFRRRGGETPTYRVPGHPLTTGLFVLACAAIVASTLAAFPANSLIGIGILLAGIPVYSYWSRANAIHEK